MTNWANNQLRPKKPYVFTLDIQYMDYHQLFISVDHIIFIATVVTRNIQNTNRQTFEYFRPFCCLFQPTTTWRAVLIIVLYWIMSYREFISYNFFDRVCLLKELSFTWNFLKIYRQFHDANLGSVLICLKVICIIWNHCFVSRLFRYVHRVFAMCFKTLYW